MIEVKNLVKEFKVVKKESGLKGAVKGLISPVKETKVAVNDISFKINQGEMVGYIGANGAGKSTTIKMMTGIMVPSSGELTIDGLIPYKDRKKHVSKIGVVFGQRTQLWWDLPLQETYGILKDIYRVSDEDFKRRFGYYKELLGLEEFITQPVRTLSLGQRMRADLAASLLHNPKVLFLDEPTIGLDIVVKEKILAAIKELNQRDGTTVILTTHDMSDIEELCKRIIIIDKGEKVYDGSLEEIKSKYGYWHNLEIDTSEADRDKPDHELLPELYKQVEINRQDKGLHIRFDSRKLKAGDIFSSLLKNINAADIKITETKIEAIVKEIYSGVRE